MIEREIQSLLSVEKGTQKISTLVPKILLDRMLSDYQKAKGAMPAHGLKSNALFYFAARGVLDWERSSGEKKAQKSPPHGMAERKAV